MNLKFIVLIGVVVFGFAVNILAMWLFNRRLAQKLNSLKEIADKHNEVNIAAVSPPKELTAEEKKIKEAAERERKRRERYLKNLISYDGTPQNKSQQGDDE